MTWQGYTDVLQASAKPSLDQQMLGILASSSTYVGGTCIFPSLQGGSSLDLAVLHMLLRNIPINYLLLVPWVVLIVRLHQTGG